MAGSPSAFTTLAASTTNGGGASTASAVSGASNGTKTTHTFTVGTSVAIGNIFSLVVDSYTASYQAADTSSTTVATQLAAAINGHAGVTASATGNTVTVTNVAVGTAAITITGFGAQTVGSHSAGATAPVVTTMLGQGTGTSSNQVVYLNQTGAAGGRPWAGRPLL